MTAPRRLSASLTGMSHAQLDALAISSGVEARLVYRAWDGTPINASDYLRLCAARGIDPVTGEPRSPGPIGSIHWASLSAALRIKRFQSNLGLRKGAKGAGISYSAMGRIERGEIVSIENVLKACAYLGRHPFEFTSPVSRESTETRSAA